MAPAPPANVAPTAALTATTSDRTVTVEVRHVSGPCSASDQWTLTINGNQK